MAMLDEHKEQMEMGMSSSDYESHDSEAEKAGPRQPKDRLDSGIGEMPASVRKNHKKRPRPKKKTLNKEEHKHHDHHKTSSSHERYDSGKQRRRRRDVIDDMEDDYFDAIDGIVDAVRDVEVGANRAVGRKIFRPRAGAWMRLGTTRGTHTHGKSFAPMRICGHECVRVHAPPLHVCTCALAPSPPLPLPFPPPRSDKSCGLFRGTTTFRLCNHNFSSIYYREGSWSPQSSPRWARTEPGSEQTQSSPRWARTDPILPQVGANRAGERARRGVDQFDKDMDRVAYNVRRDAQDVEREVNKSSRNANRRARKRARDIEKEANETEERVHHGHHGGGGDEYHHEASATKRPDSHRRVSLKDQPLPKTSSSSSSYANPNSSSSNKHRRHRGNRKKNSKNKKNNHDHN